MTLAKREPVRIAVIGAGPAGLAATIYFRRLDGVELQVFEGAKELREVGAGIAINENTWRHLQKLGAAQDIEQFFTRGDGTKVAGEQRNGRTGELLLQSFQPVDPDKPPTSRIERYKLQQALLKQVPAGVIQLSKRLSNVIERPEGTWLVFNGEDDKPVGPFDLVIGADGIRSAVRQYAFPDHKLFYTGKVAFRVIIPQSKVAHIKGIPEGATFWHTKETHVYTNPLDHGLFEIATRAIIPAEEGEKVSWGQKVDKSQVVGHYNGYCDTIRAIIDAPDEWLEFAMFGGPRLESVVQGGRIALLGDASHPLSGAFGSGAAFAFEDAFVLSAAIDIAIHTGRDLSWALKAYDIVRSPHYKALYEILDGFANNVKEVIEAVGDDDEDAYIAETTKRNWSKKNGWIYQYDVTEVWKQWVAQNVTTPVKQSTPVEPVAASVEISASA
ncbi:FAD/NAD-P-binding domain-containing protein [Naematelia encephala]|uniref:FAD/NAD-P-binding domain-containing protein n=1 Tax=Naematelia encephala TaxID=71784 RepID=A0A1Y2BDW4_9TREE|nr:FAD/NAD-P-binding domain-containing protein [Naematelia encephala]